MTWGPSQEADRCAAFLEGGVPQIDYPPARPLPTHTHIWSTLAHAKEGSGVALIGIFFFFILSLKAEVE